MSSIYKRGGVWQVQFKDHAGKTFQRSLRTRSKAEARVMQKEVDRQMGGPRRRPPIPGDPTSGQTYLVKDLTEAFQAHAEEYYRKGGEPTSTMNRVKSVLEALQPYHRMPVNEFKPSCLRAVRDEWVTADFARTTVNQYHSLLLQVFRWGVAHEMVRPETLVGLDAVQSIPAGRGMARETERVKPVPEADLEAVKAVVPPLVRDMIDLYVLTCARPGELFLLTVGDVDRTSKEVWKAEVREHKTAHRGKTRTLYFGPQAQALLAPHLEGRDPKEPVFPAKARNLRDTICAACKRAGVETWSLNQLRHLGATRVRAAVNAETASILLGHSNLSTTEIYAEKNEAVARAAALALG